MLIDFSITNYRSIKNEQTLSMVSNSGRNDTDYNKIKVKNEKFDLLTSCIIYGPNASGKSNIIKGIIAFKEFILNSSDLKLDEPILIYNPFKLNKESQTSPMKFEIEFITDGLRYRYYIEFNKAKILKEELIFYPEGRKATLFSRDGEKIKYGIHLKGEKKSIEKMLLPNTLFLSRAVNLKMEQLFPVYRFFRYGINFRTKMDSEPYATYNTTQILKQENDALKKSILNFLKAADLNIEDIKIEKVDIDPTISQLADGVQESIKLKLIEAFRYRPKIAYPVFSENGNIADTIYLDLKDDESGGTMKMFELAGVILNALETGTVLFIDEFDSGLHPFLNKYLIQLFHNPKTNPNGAQLIAATHDVCIMDIEKIRRDQIWFTEKNNYGATELYSLDEFDKNLIREKTPFPKWYLDGRFRAIPNVNINKLNLNTSKKDA